MTLLQRLGVVVLGSLLAVAGIGCADDGFPDPPYYHQCTSDEECGPLYECVGGRDNRVCTRACTTASECPPVTGCTGAQALCNGGFCTFAGCL